MNKFRMNFLKRFSERFSSKNNGGFSLLELVLAVGIILTLSTGGAIAAVTVQESAQKALVNNAVDEVYTVALSKSNMDDNQFNNPAFLAADEWIDTSDKESSKGVDLRGFLVDENGNITEDRSATIVIVGVSKGLGYDKDGYPYFYWKTELDVDKADMWNLIQKHNAYLKEHENDKTNNM